MIKIYCFNKLDNNFKKLFEFYENKIKMFNKLQFVVLEELSTIDLKNNLKKNSQKLDLLLEKNEDLNHVYIFDVISKQVDSYEFSKIIDLTINVSTKTIIFVVGPSNGFSSDFLKKYKNKISFGLITFPHQLFKIVLLEQIYRAFKILNNQNYHK